MSDPVAAAVTTWYLEMRDPSDLRPARPPQPLPRIEQVEIPSPEFSRFLYTSIGGDWHWRDRLGWNWQRWMDYLDRPQVQTWVMYVHGAPSGFVELERQDPGDVEIAYFGIAPRFIGRGLGGWLLTFGIEKAWDMGAARVWVHTCTLDHPRALDAYQRRGMVIYKTETDTRLLQPRPPGPWPGAYDNGR